MQSCTICLLVYTQRLTIKLPSDQHNMGGSVAGKKHPLITYSYGYFPISLINFLHLLGFVTSSLFSGYIWQSFPQPVSTFSSVCLYPLYFIIYTFSPSHSRLFKKSTSNSYLLICLKIKLTAYFWASSILATKLWYI